VCGISVSQQWHVSECMNTYIHVHIPGTYTVGVTTPKYKNKNLHMFGVHQVQMLIRIKTVSFVVTITVHRRYIHTYIHTYIHVHMY
jgi:hypothetical protein